VGGVPTVVVVLAVLAAAVLLAAAWEGLVASLMYTSRQHHRAADFSVGRRTIVDGEALAVLQLPAIGLNEVVAEGASVDNLRGGPAHVTGTVLPGAPGASVIVGKSTRYGGPFADLDRVKAGDLVMVKVRANAPVAFTVTKVDRRSSPGTVELDTADPTLVLATGRGGLLSSGVTVVTATAPQPAPTDKAVTPGPPLHGTWRLTADRGNPLINREAVLAYAALIALVLVVRFLSRRVRPLTFVAVVAPLVVLVFVLGALELDRVLPPLR
jgi:LPXTG-site transpeptidase (sortase) family protein